MGLLIKGTWHDQWYDTSSTGGEFVRTDAQFRNTISNEAGAEYPAEPDRYHLFVSLACPWAHRTLILRKLKKLPALRLPNPLSQHQQLQQKQNLLVQKLKK